MRRIEILHGRSDTNRKRGGIILGDRANTIGPGNDIVPGFLQVEANRGNDTQSSNDYATS